MRMQVLGSQRSSIRTRTDAQNIDYRGLDFKMAVDSITGALLPFGFGTYWKSELETLPDLILE
ncbi:hypothetical protein AAF712_016667, partial [Marasmius tenuissimus]